jgi:predicted lactoylglutathione lyase
VGRGDTVSPEPPHPPNAVGRSPKFEDRSGIEKRLSWAAPSMARMAPINSVILEVADPSAAQQFYTAAFGVGSEVSLRDSEAPSTGFRGFTLSLIVSQPATAKGFIDSAVNAGAKALKPGAKSFWGYGGVIQAPDGAIWKVACSAKKDTSPATLQIDQIVLLLGVEDVRASKEFYLGRGLPVAKSFASKYVEFDTQSSPIKLGLYKRRALAKDAGVSPDGGGSHRIAIDGDTGSFADPDGFSWESPQAETNGASQ